MGSVTMKNISKITLTPEFNLLVERYQQDNGIKTKTGALYELIARGYADWQNHGADHARWTETPQQEAVLFDEHEQQDKEHWFALWFARKFAPKHGGDRKSGKAG